MCLCGPKESICIERGGVILKQQGVEDKYLRVVQDKYKGSVTRVRCAVGVADGLKVKVGLYQGTALSLEWWRYALEKSRRRRSRKECLCVNEREDRRCKEQRW